MVKLFFIISFFTAKTFAFNQAIEVYRPIQDNDVQIWENQIRLSLGDLDYEYEKIIKFLSNIKDNSAGNLQPIMQKSYNSFILLKTLKFFEGYFSNLTEGANLDDTKNIITISPMYESMLKFTAFIYDFLNHKKNEAYVQHDTIRIFYKKYQQDNYIFGIIPLFDGQKNIYIPFVENVKNNSKIKVTSRFSALDISPIELYIKDKKIIQSNCLFLIKRGSLNTLFFYSGKFSDNPYCRFYNEHAFYSIFFKKITDVAEEIKAIKWDDESYYVELFSSKLEKLGFLDGFNNYSFGQEDLLLEYFEDNVEVNDVASLPIMAEQESSFINEYEQILQQEWENIRKRVVEESVNSAKNKTINKKNKRFNKKQSASNISQENKIGRAHV